MSCWTDEDQLVILSYHSATKINQLHYLLVYNENVTSNAVDTFQYVTQKKLM